ncbi:MAG TPA: cytochrome c [Dyella sp.]|uniref:c-type cytochrome n=1 Tax=Dyella sp. TaxID=1869338 RepID=UPI002F948A75
MKRFLSIVIVLVAIGAVAYFWLNRTDPAAGTAPAIVGAPTGSDVIARGEYLAKAADCTACHTVPGSNKPFAGGVAFTLPFGTIYSSNITADETTGIGSWSDDDFVRAVREGVRKDGAHLYPAFPYTSYTQLSRADVLAIKAYLFSLPKIQQENRANVLDFPFNQRWAMGFWNAAFFKSKRFEPDTSKSAQWNSGAYLANALGHCDECHTPRNFAFGLKRGSALSGESLQGWRAYDITSDPQHGIGSWSDEDLTSYLRTGHAEGRGSASGPMAEAVENSLQYLKPDDIAALVTYLRGVPSHSGKDPITIDAKAAPALASNDAAPGGDSADGNQLGLRLFEGACASCHQWNGKGQQTAYATLLGTRGVNDPSGGNITQVILHGSKWRVADQDVYMPAFGKAYSDTEVAALANYVIAHFGAKQGIVTPQDVAQRR